MESDQEILTMITHTNIDIGAFRISNSDKEKSIDQTNSDDYFHEYLPFVEGKPVKIRYVFYFNINYTSNYLQCVNIHFFLRMISNFRVRIYSRKLYEFTYYLF